METESLWNRFTERSRRTVSLAQQEAARLSFQFVGTEHLLVGLVKESQTNEWGVSVALRILQQIGVDPLELLKGLERERRSLPSGHQAVDSAETRLTPRGKRVLDLAIEDAHQRGKNYLGTEHILVGLICGGGLAERVLLELGVTFVRVNGVIEEMEQQERGGGSR